MGKVKIFFRKIPRAGIYLGLGALTAALFKVLFTKLKKGEKTTALENKLSEHFGVKYTILLPRARTALFYLLKNLNLLEGSEVIMTPLTIADIANAVRWAKLKPVFCDLGENTYNIDYQKIEELITPKTKVLLVTHLNGLASDMNKILEIVKKHNLTLIEDASQAFNAEYKGKMLGTFGTAGIFSLSFLKTFCTLFGGALVLNDSALAVKIRQESANLPHPPKMMLIKEILKNMVLAIVSNRTIFSLKTYYFIKLSYATKSNFVNKFIKSNPKPTLTDSPSQKYLYSYTDAQAQIGLKILSTVRLSDKKRIENASYLIDSLSEKAKSKLPRTLKEAGNTFWRLPIQIDESEKFKKYLFRNYVDCAPTNLVLISEEPTFAKYSNFTPQARRAYEAIFIPVHSSFSKKDMLYMAKLLNNYFSLKE